MGATSFGDTIIGRYKHAGEAYDELVEEALYEKGHDSYNGTISTTQGVIDKTNDAPRYGTKAFNVWEDKAFDNGICNKWGNAIAIEIKGATFKRMKERRGWKGKKGIKAFYMFGIAAE
jgi:hypothetical protein